MKFDLTTLLWVGAAAAAVYYLSQQATAAATPLSIYPSLAWTGATTTSMATTPAQKASTVVPSSSLFTTTQSQAQSALLTQCTGAYPGCTPMLGDTQLGF